MESARKVVQANRSQKIQFTQKDVKRQPRDVIMVNLQMLTGPSLLQTLSRSLTPRSTQTRQEEQFLADSFRKERAANGLTANRPSRDTASNRIKRHPSKDYSETRSRVTSSQESVKRQPQKTRISMESGKQKTVGTDMQTSLSTKINPHESRSRSIQPDKADRQSKMQLQFTSPLLKGSVRNSRVEDHYQCKSQFKNTWSDLVKLSRVDSPSASSRNPLKSSLLSPAPSLAAPFNFKPTEKPVVKTSHAAIQPKGIKSSTNPKPFITQASVVKKPDQKPTKTAINTAAKKQKESRNLTPPTSYSVKDSKRFLLTPNVPEPLGTLKLKSPTLQSTLISKSRLTTETLRSTANLADSISRGSVSRDSSWQHKPKEPRASSKKKKIADTQKNAGSKRIRSPKGGQAETTADSRQSESNSVGPQKITQFQRPAIQKAVFSTIPDKPTQVPAKPVLWSTIPANPVASKQEPSDTTLITAAEIAKQVLVAQPPVIAMRQQSQISAYAVQTFRLDLGKALPKSSNPTQKPPEDPNGLQSPVVPKLHHRIAVFFTPFTTNDSSSKATIQQPRQLSIIGVYTSASAQIASLLKKSLHHELKSSPHFPHDIPRAFASALAAVDTQAALQNESTTHTALRVLVADSSPVLRLFASGEGLKQADTGCWVGGRPLDEWAGVERRDLGTTFGGRPIVLKTFKMDPNTSSKQDIVLSDAQLQLSGVATKSQDLALDLQNVLQQVVLRSLASSASPTSANQTLSLAIIKVASIW